MLILRAIVSTIFEMTPYYMLHAYAIGKSIVWDAPRRFYLDVELEYLHLKRLSEPEPEPEPETKNLINTLLSRYWRIYK